MVESDMKILRRASAVLISAAILLLYAAKSVDEIRITRRQQPEIRNCDPENACCAENIFSYSLCRREQQPFSQIYVPDFVIILVLPKRKC